MQETRFISDEDTQNHLKQLGTTVMNFLSAYPNSQVAVYTTNDWGREKYIITLEVDYKRNQKKSL